MSTDIGTIAAIFVLALAASGLVLWSVQRYLGVYAKKTKTRIDDLIVSLLRGPVVLFVVAYGLILLVRALAGTPSQTSTGLFESLDLAYAFLLVLVVTWIVARLFVGVMQKYAQNLALKTESKIDDVSVRVFTKTGRLLILTVGIAIALGLLWMTLGLLRLAAGL